MKYKEAKKRYTRSWWPAIAVGGGGILFLCALTVSGIFSALHDATPTNRLANGELPVLWTVPALSSTNHNNQSVTNTDLHGHVLILDFIFTHCTSACPLITAQMVILQKILRQPEVRFLSVSVDPVHDTPAVLKDYAANWNRDESRWQLLSLPRDALQQFATAMKVAVVPVDDSTDEILHSDLFFLVDQQSRVRGVYSSSDAAAVRQLGVDAVGLVSGQAAPVAANVAPLSESENGERLFNTLGCAGCHNQTRIAPPLGGVFGKPVRFSDGSDAYADDAYLRESIIDPGAKMVAGYLEIMPSYRDYLSDTQITQLVTYLRTLPKLSANQAPHTLEVAAQQPPQTTTIDPVCNMGVTVSHDTPHAEYLRKVYYFCSDHCRLQFTHEPAKYSGKEKRSSR